MEFGKAFTFAFEDQDWIKKVLLAGLIGLIPIVGQLFVLGWGLEIARRVIKQDPQPLPDWNNFGGYLLDGLKGAVIALVYALPIILVQACSQGITFGAAELISDYETAGTITMVVMVCFGCLTFIYAILMGLILPAAMGSFVATDQLGAAFRFGQVFKLFKAAPVSFVLVLLGSLIASFIGSLGVILCFVGVIFTSAYASAINGHLTGQAYNTAKAALGESL
jgi:hypothetical protein